jgi:hypothetical protein
MPVHPFPNESNLLTLSDSSTTVNLPELVPETSEGRISSIDSCSILSEDFPKCGASLALVQNSSSGSPSRSSVETVYLTEGEPINDFVNFSRPFRLYITESLEVHLGLENESSARARKQSMGYCIKRFTVDKLRYFREKCPVVDVQQLDGEVLCQLSEDCAFCLVAGDVVLKVNSQGWIEDE